MMKKIISLAACLIGLVACSKVGVEQGSDSHLTEGPAFKAGQEVTLTVSTTQTRVSSELSGSTVNFKWEEGDKILVTVEGSSSEFTLVTGAGQTSGTFVGSMPASGEHFDAQFPVTDPDLSNQVYSSTEPFPHNKVKFAATGCTVGEDFSLAPQYSALQLNFWGTDISLDSIVVTNTTASAKYKLDCSASPVSVGATSSGATPFLIVVPAGSYSFSSEVFTASAGSSTLLPRPDDALNGVFTVGGTPSTKVFTTSGAKTLTAGNVLNMSAKQVTEGALTKVYFSKGNLQATYNSSTSSYSWGFAANQYDYIGDAAGNTTIGSQSNGAVVDLFGWSTSSTNYGINTSDLNSTYSGVFKDWGEIESLPGNSASKKVWRTLSGGESGEWNYLVSTRKVTVAGVKKASYGEGSVNGVNGMIILPDNWDGSVCSGFTYGTSAWSNTFAENTSPKWSDMVSAGCVFLPAAGYRYGSSVGNVGSDGRYWSSTPNGTNYAYYLLFFSSNVFPAGYGSRSRGNSVRLVSAAQ